MTAQHVKIRQRKGSMRAGQFPGDSPVADCCKFPHVLDHPEVMFAAGARTRAKRIDALLMVRQAPARLSPPIDPIADSFRASTVAVKLAPLRLIATAAERLAAAKAKLAIRFPKPA